MKRSIPLVPVLLLMIATLLVVVRVAFALDSDAARFEAETMSEDSGKISVVDDNGTQALRFVNTPASASKSVSFSAIAQMAKIRVRGVDRGGDTRTLGSVRVTVDGAQVLSQQVSGSYYYPHGSHVTWCWESHGERRDDEPRHRRPYLRGLDRLHLLPAACATAFTVLRG